MTIAKLFPVTDVEAAAIESQIAKVKPKDTFADVGPGPHADHSVLSARPAVLVVTRDKQKYVLVDRFVEAASRDEFAEKLAVQEKTAIAAKLAVAAELVAPIEAEPIKEAEEPIKEVDPVIVGDETPATQVVAQEK